MMNMSLADLGLIGNCQLSALVRRDGAIVWSCLPRFDSAPVFGALLDEADGGRFSISPAIPQKGTQRYLPNTNVLETRFTTADGAFRVLDFAPRFMQYERSFRPTKLVRIVEPLSGTPRIRVLCDPILGWGKQRPRREAGSHHISFQGYEADVRLTTDAPLSYLHDDSFALTERKHFVFSWGAPVEQPLEPLCERFLRETVKYWQLWVKHCDIPPQYQEQVIRSALALKLHCFEDTGAIVAALTTSIPEAPGSGRNWDSSRTTAARKSTRRCSRRSPCASCRPKIPGRWPPSRPFAATSSTTAGCDAIAPTTVWAYPRWPSVRAPSG